MCTVCGCHSAVKTRPEEAAGEPKHAHHYGLRDPQSRVDPEQSSQPISIEKDILSKNDRYAEANRRQFEDAGQLALNLVSSPGAGKTTLLVETLSRLKETFEVAVIEGDQETSADADRIRATGVPAVQINTGSGCHLDAHMVGHALKDLPTCTNGIVFIENVGNLVCPAAFDLGESAKVVILSTTEGDDKPLKYPDMFRAADLMVLSKTDLLPYVPFSAEAACANAKVINPELEILEVSATTGAGMAAWLNWIVTQATKTIATTGQQHA
ncbi:MAG: hydrogenase nickel incorporation protein HypB [Pseudomonadota bacterium]